MSREVHVRICEGVGVRLPRATRLAMLDFSRDRMHEDRSPISRTRKRHAGHAARGERCHEDEQEQEDAGHVTASGA